MKTTFIHTADWQLGKPFASVREDEKRGRLRAERIEVVGRIGRMAHDAGASFIVVAGDLFDSSTVSRDVVSAACLAIGALGLPVFAIPGNHDHGGVGSVWEQAYFLRERDQLAPNLQVLMKAEPIELDDAVVLPCPLLRRHESDDPTGWVRDYLEAGADFGGKPRIVIAHGSVQGFGAASEAEDGACFPNLIDVVRLEALPVDYVALGDWHGLKAVGTRSWYSGTPEPDRFPRGDEHRQGSVLMVTAQRGGLPVVEPLATAGMQWGQLAVSIEGDDALDQLDARLREAAGSRLGQTLLRLELSGAIGIEAMRKLDERLESWQARLLDLRLENAITVAPTEAEIDGLTRRSGDPLIARVAQELLLRVDTGGDGAAVAMTALRSLYALCSAPPFGGAQ